MFDWFAQIALSNFFEITRSFWNYFLFEFYRVFLNCFSSFFAQSAALTICEFWCTRHCRGLIKTWRDIDRRLGCLRVGCFSG